MSIGELNSSAWVGELCRRLTGCRLIYYIHGEEITTQFDAGSFGNKRFKYLARADAIVAVSSFTKNALLALGLASNRVHLIENAVDTTRFSPGPTDPLFLKRWNLIGKRIVLSIGRLIHRKGFDQTIRAWRSVLAKHPNAHLLIIGAGPQRKELEELIGESGLQQAMMR